MYEEYFCLRENPFSIAPDTRYFYMSEGHREALAHLLYGIERDGGFVLLSGEVGTGKTMVCRCLLERMPETSDVAFILNPKLTAAELLQSVCDEFGIKYPKRTTSTAVFVTRINDFLLDVHARGRRAVLILEEAQNLSTEVLEQIRLLTNLETSERKLLQVIMVGQPEIRDMLEQPALRQLSQRITARYHLGPLNRKELSEYVKFRLSAAGLERGRELFPEAALRKLYRLTGGVPRLINVICDRALLGAYIEGKEQVDARTLRTAAREVSGNGMRRLPGWKVYLGAATVTLAILVVVLGLWRYAGGPETSAQSLSKTVARERTDVDRRANVTTSTVEKPSGGVASGTRETAYQALFRKWQVDYNPAAGQSVCEQARAQGLRCLQGSGGSVGGLRQINKPVVLRLRDGKGSEYFAVLSSLKSDTATCLVGDEVRTLDAGTIEREWSGEYVLLWRVPSDYAGKLTPGRRGPLVAWLDRQLTLIQGGAARSGQDQVYDEEMRNRVKAFQRAVGLKPDGLAGPGTIMALTAATGEGGPVLSDGKARK